MFRRPTLRPVGVAVLSLFVLLSGSGLLGFGALLTFMPSLVAVGGLVDVSGTPLLFGVLGSSYQLIMDVSFGVAFLLILLGFGLWRGSNFARVFFMLLQVLQGLLCLLFLGPAPWVSAIGVGLSLVVVGYLHIPSVRSFFE